VTDLLCLPGLGLEPSAWRGAVDMSASVGSLPAYGARPGWTDDLRPAVLGDQVAQRLSRRTVLLGHSASCQVVARAAAASPEQVRAVVLVGPTTDPRAASWRALAGRWLRTAVRERPWQVPFLVRSYARTGPVWMWRAMEAARHEDIRADLCRVTAPVLVVRGRHDRICPEDWAHEVVAAAPAGSRMVSLDEGAHMVPLTHGEMLAAAVRGAVG
jgi:pimeloyl-ACP methyl ester carboxylesterase